MAKVARKLPHKASIHLTHIYNAILRLSNFPTQWKFSVIILFPKPNKPTGNPASYFPISLLPLVSKLLEKLILKRIYPIIVENNIIPNSQFGFREKHSTIHQIHRLADAISCSPENKQYTSAVFLDVSQAFYKVWHPGLLYKLKKILPPSFYLLLNSYLKEPFFAVSSGAEIYNISPILAGVSQGVVLSPTLYNIHTADQPIHPDTSVAEYADDKVIYSTHIDPLLTVSTSLQNHLDLFSLWYSQWRIKINETKSINTTLTLTGSKCKEIHQHRVYYTPLGNIISGLKINQTILVSHTSCGALDREGNCVGTTFTNPKGTWHKVIIQAKYSIQLAEEIATANNKENILILPSGSKLKLSDSYGLDQYKGEIVWQIEHQECSIREFDVLYDGEASLVKATTYNSNTESFIVETNHTAISLKKLSLSYACNIPVYKTDNPQLLIIADQNYADSFTPKQITPFSADLLSYLNTKFVYLEFTVKRTTTKLLIINTTI
ncbi:Reverse transcriptase domain [Cinara cedri]|uniref:Reverse transcriptase domain n=1 Tax=Cinara cedri TaxID=506608 RepID=A0A5E4N3S8_9HEMI|nr:Reverse transcriptase domain [Cinara cedri]